ncbi:SUMO-activating enzyme subunit 2 [Glugoides intestinalis]
MASSDIKILVVGCGGLGCELIKLLAQDPSNKLTLIDDDSIDVTNLNRQFLFTKEDVGREKAEVTGEKVRMLLGSLESVYVCRIDNFKRIEFYKQFNIVYNCLDNDETRSFVNQRCYLAGVQMIDGGSAGWLGQSFSNKKQCFDCLPKRVVKEYPVCTLREKPKSFEHCLAWAKVFVEELVKEAGDMEEMIKKIRNSNIKEAEECLTSIRDQDISRLIQELEKPDENVKRVKKAELLNKFKDSEESLIYELAKFRGEKFSITPFSFLEAQSFLKRIIPSICTTNSIIASLMILSTKKNRNYFLVQGSSVILETVLDDKRKDCLTCYLPLYIVTYVEETRILDILSHFKADFLISADRVFSNESTECLDQFEGDFLICSKKGTKSRFYFERGEGLLIRRAK